MAQQANALQVQSKGMYDLLIKRKDSIAALMPKHLTPERLIRGVMAQATRNPLILQCTPVSVMNGVLIAAQLGLEIGRIRGGGYLVPFKNGRTGKYEATFIPDYRGLMDLAYRSGQVSAIEARAVHEGDDFDYAYGLDSKLHHVPSDDADPAKITHVYAVARLRNADHPFFTVLTKHDVDLVRARSRAKDEGPWKTDYEAMALKSVVKRLVNWLPQAQGNDTLARAADYDDLSDAGENVTHLFQDLEDGGEPNPTTTDKIKGKLAQGATDAETRPVQGDGAEQNDPAPEEGQDPQEPGEPSPAEKLTITIGEFENAEELARWWESTGLPGAQKLSAKEQQAVLTAYSRQNKRLAAPKK